MISAPRSGTAPASFGRSALALAISAPGRVLGVAAAPRRDRLGGRHADQGRLRRAPARPAEPAGAPVRRRARERHGRLRRARRDRPWRRCDEPGRGQVDGRLQAARAHRPRLQRRVPGLPRGWHRDLPGPRARRPAAFGREADAVADQQRAENRAALLPAGDPLPPEGRGAGREHLVPDPGHVARRPEGPDRRHPQQARPPGRAQRRGRRATRARRRRELRALGLALLADARQPARCCARAARRLSLAAPGAGPADPDRAGDRLVGARAGARRHPAQPDVGHPRGARDRGRDRVQRDPRPPASARSASSGAALARRCATPTSAPVPQCSPRGSPRSPVSAC